MVDLDARAAAPARDPALWRSTCTARLDMMRILVTGGAGFLGSHLCERLVAEGHHVLCVDDFSTGRRENLARLRNEPRFELIERDVIGPDFEAEFGLDERPPLRWRVARIYHLACPASPVHYQRDPVRTIRTALEGTRNMLALGQAARARVLVASTSEVYGDPQVHPQVESYWGHVNPVGERACYDEGKRCAEALATSYARTRQVQVRIARIFNTYGPRMHAQDGRVVSNFVVQALRGEPLTVYGSGQQTRSFCYVSDLIDALLRLMECEVDPGPVNLGNPEEIPIAELAELVRAMTGSSSPLERRPLPSDDPKRRRPDITRARQVLGWSPQIGVREGLRATIEHFRRQLVPASERAEPERARADASSR
jgi:UDP-glucuronate decarboxylase